MPLARCSALAAAVLAFVGAGACRSEVQFHPRWPDAQLELRDDGDREQAIDAMWAMPLGAERDRARARVVAALDVRITDAIADEQPFVAAALLDQLTTLWQRDPAAVGRGLAGSVRLLHDLKATFGKAGALEPTVQTLVLLAEVDADQRARHLAELDEVLGFADELAVVENGADATRAQPLALLESTVLALPLDWLVDRYVALAVERQRAVAALIDRQGASMQLVRAHRDLLASSRRIAGALARAHRAPEIHRHLARLLGTYGVDKELAARAEIVADQPTAAAYSELASALAIDEGQPDPTAALAVCLDGLAKFPNDAGLIAAAGGHARALGQTELAILFYERALDTTGEVDNAVALRLGKLYADRIQRLATSGRPSAATDAWRAARRFADDAASRHPGPVWEQTTALAESALGRGFASQGMIDDARVALTSSLERAPVIDTYETLAQIAVQTEHYADAQRWVREGVALLGDASSGDRYRRAKLERLAGEGMRRAGKQRPAAEHYLMSLRTWAQLGDSKDLPRGVAAERELDMGRTMWGLGDASKAVELAMRAIEHDPDSEELATTAVAFLIQAGQFRDALDAYHRTLSEPGISEYHKVYMSLWVLGEAVRRGEPRDRLASEYVAGRNGNAWYEQLAQLAAGRRTLAELTEQANTGPRRAELMFYATALRLDPRAATPAGRRQLYAQVIAAKLILDAEYDLARLYLASEAKPAATTPAATPATPAAKPATPAAKPSAK